MDLLRAIYELAVNDDVAEFHRQMGMSPEDFKEKEGKVKGEFGSLYWRAEYGRVYYFVVKEEVDDGWYECYLATSYYELSNQNDLISRDPVSGDYIAVHTWLNIYLKESEIASSVYLGKLPEEDVKILKQLDRMKIKQLPEEKRGLTVYSQDSYQIKYHEFLSKRFRDLSLRVFFLMEEQEEGG